MSTNLTFYVWADTHYGYDQRFGDEDQRARTISQMNNLPKWPYPTYLGGGVDEPEFVLLCGDAVDGKAGEGEVELGCFHHYTQRLHFPQLELMGNHDLDPAYAGYFRDRYGGFSHSFDRQGIHFVCLNSLYDKGEHFGVEELVFLRDDLTTVADDTPVILFVHCRLDRFANGGDILNILEDHRVILICSAHVHKPAVFQLRGIDCIDVGQCRNHPIDPEYGRNLYVAHVTDSRLTAVPWRWDLGDWERGQPWADPEATARRFTLEKTL